MSESRVEFGLGGAPDVLIAVLLQDGTRASHVVRQMAEGVRYALAARESRAVDYTVGIAWHTPHAHEIGSDHDVIGVLGPLRSAETGQRTRNRFGRLIR